MRMSTFLRRTLAVDGATCAAMAVGLILAGGPLSGLTGLPAPLLMTAGLILVPVAGLMFWLARREDAPKAMIWLVIGGNAGWIASSLLMLAAGWVKPTLAGEVFVVVQALGVAGLTVLEAVGLRRARTPLTA